MSDKIRKVESKQTEVQFSFCPHPVTIDKSEDWGPNNVQNFPNGVFLKHTSEINFPISHGVQPNEQLTAPVGWLPEEYGTFRKKPIFIGEELKVGTIHELDTLDGIINYEVKEPSILCYNGDEEPNLKDVYVQSIADLNKNYFID